MIRATDYEISKFPDGTPLIKKQLRTFPDVYNIVWQYESMAELPTVLMIANDIKNANKQACLFMPYIPNARMDRVHAGDVFTLKWFAQMINNAGFSKVYVFDPHSNVAPALIDRCYINPIEFVLLRTIDKSDPDVIYFPDAGAMKRYEGAIHDIKGNRIPIIHGYKRRDWDTGKILGLDVIGDVPAGAKILMIDDICSYGGTMFYSAKKLKELGAGDIDMYVSHCENSILDPERGHLFDDPDLIHQVYTTDSTFTGHHEKINVLKVDWEGDSID